MNSIVFRVTGHKISIFAEQFYMQPRRRPATTPEPKIRPDLQLCALCWQVQSIYFK